MKSNIAPIILALAAIAAPCLLPIGLAAAGPVLVTTGLLSVFAADYGRSLGGTAALGLSKPA